MPQLVIVILDDLDHLPGLLAAWRAIGVPGATILTSVGAHRAESWLSRVGFGGLGRLFEAEDVPRRTLLAAINDDLVDEAIAEADRVVGGFNQPHTGALMVVPLLRTMGTQQARAEATHEPLPPAVQDDWTIRRHTTIAQLNARLKLEATTVAPGAPVGEVIRAMLDRPNVHVACVVDDGILVGLLDLPTLAEDVLYHIMPEEFLSDVTDLEDVMAFADRSRVRTAADAMQPPAWVTPEETVKEAYRRMHERKLTGLPVVDGARHVVGYLNLLELLAICADVLPDDQAN